MKNRGQALVLFILLLPFMLILFLNIINFGILCLEKRKTDNIVKEIIEQSLNKNLEEQQINDLIVTNLDSIIKKEVKKEEKTLEITVIRKLKIISPTIVKYENETYKVTYKGINDSKIEIVRK